MHDRVQWKTQRPRHQSTKSLKAPVKWSASYRCVIHKSTTTTHQMKQKTTRVYQPSTPCIQCTAETTKYQNVVWSINDVDMLYLSSWIVRRFHVTSCELNLDSQSKKQSTNEVGLENEDSRISETTKWGADQKTKNMLCRCEKLWCRNSVSRLSNRLTNSFKKLSLEFEFAILKIENWTIHQGNKTGDSRPEVEESSNRKPDTEITDKKWR